MPLYNDEAVVLKTFPLGEADRIVVMLTKKHGKIRAVAKGVRKIKSRFGARLEPFMRVNALFATGRTFDVVSQAVLVSAYAESICADYDLYSRASMIAEIADDLVSSSAQYQDSCMQYNLLVAALSALSRGLHSADSIGFSYVLRALKLAGWSPMLNECVVCATKDDLSYFSSCSGGVMCSKDHDLQSIKCNDSARFQMISLINGDWKNIDGTDIDYLTYRCVEQWCEYYLERPIKSMHLLENNM
ncbi:DNA repair protein RecO [Gardnerella vaginalis]|uniref:DNA repair protein RecO n=1 Tax=Gardnerella vaginalis TaxID=2702 RepID=UPI003971159D